MSYPVTEPFPFVLSLELFRGFPQQHQTTWSSKSCDTLDMTEEFPVIPAVLVALRTDDPPRCFQAIAVLRTHDNNMVFL